MGLFSRSNDNDDLPDVPFYEYAKGGALHGIHGGKTIGEVMREERRIEEHRAELRRAKNQPEDN